QHALPARGVGGQYCSHSKRISVLAPKAEIDKPPLPMASSSSATAEPSSLTSTSPPRSIALTTGSSGGWSVVSNARAPWVALAVSEFVFRYSNRVALGR